jgi:hypothetical protein
MRRFEDRYSSGARPQKRARSRRCSRTPSTGFATSRSAGDGAPTSAARPAASAAYRRTHRRTRASSCRSTSRCEPIERLFRYADENPHLGDGALALSRSRSRPPEGCGSPRSPTPCRRPSRAPTPTAPRGRPRASGPPRSRAAPRSAGPPPRRCECRYARRRRLRSPVIPSLRSRWADRQRTALWRAPSATACPFPLVVGGALAHRPCSLWLFLSCRSDAGATTPSTAAYHRGLGWVLLTVRRSNDLARSDINGFVISLGPESTTGNRATAGEAAEEVMPFRSRP